MRSRKAQRIRIGGILTYPDMWLFGITTSPDRPGIACSVFEALGDQGINVQLIVQGVDLERNTNIHFCVSKSDREAVAQVLRAAVERLQSSTVDEGCPVFVACIYGPDFRTRPGIAGRVFGALARAGINILAISTSVSTVSCVVHEAAGKAALEALQDAFELP